MAKLITAILTADGPTKIDYNALANKPTADSFGAVPNTITINGKQLNKNIVLTASDIGAGTFAGQVAAKSSAQTPSTSLLRNSKLVSVETDPTVEGEICWIYG